MKNLTLLIGAVTLMTFVSWLAWWHLLPIHPRVALESIYTWFAPSVVAGSLVLWVSAWITVRLSAKKVHYFPLVATGLMLLAFGLFELAVGDFPAPLWAALLYAYLTAWLYSYWRGHDITCAPMKYSPPDESGRPSSPQS